MSGAPPLVDKLGLERLELDDEALARVAELVDVGRDPDALLALGQLPASQRDAVLAHVLSEREYRDIAREAGCSEALVRQRVSRGLRPQTQAGANDMSNFIADYGEQLRQAGWRRIERRHRLLRGHLPRRLLVSLAVLAVAAPAVAQTGVWRPLLGDGRGPEPTTSSQPAAERQREILSVLCREQRPADRGAQTAYALRFLGASVSDVHTSSIRLLHVEPDGRGIVLIPVGQYNAGSGVGAAMRPEHDRLSGPDRLCLFAADQ